LVITFTAPRIKKRGKPGGAKRVKFDPRALANKITDFLVPNQLARNGTVEAILRVSSSKVSVMVPPETPIWTTSLGDVFETGVFETGGGPVALAHQTSINQLDLAMINGTGAVSVLSVIADGQWQIPIQITKPNVAPSGGRVAMAHQTSFNQLDVVFGDSTGAISVSSVTGQGQWQGPIPVTKPGFAPPGSSVALAHQTSMNQLDLAVVGNNGVVSLLLVIGEGHWSFNQFSRRASALGTRN
jgi:hypothetical protein